jgi:acetolactate synthase-1/2/3 large subunit
MRSGGQLLVDCLIALGARKCFGVPGESYLAVLDALHDTKGTLDYVLCRQEGGAAFMAAAYGKLTGSPGICLVTRGPGVTNASIGAHTAMQDSAPMILFVGQVGTDMKGREAFQEIDYRAVYGTMVKWATEIDQVDRIPEVLSRTWALATSGRPGPVVIALPEDMLREMTDVTPLTGPARIAEPAADDATMRDALDILSKAKRPLILIGGCNWSPVGQAALKDFAEKSDIPVVAAFRYQDMIDNHSPVFCGEAGVGMPPHVRRLITEADTILAINTRFGESTTDGYTLLDVPHPKQRLIHVHGSPLEIAKVYQPELGIVAGPTAFVSALSPISGEWAEWRSQARSDYEASQKAPVQPSSVDMGRVVAYLQKRLPDDAVITNGAGNFAIWSGKFFRFGVDQRLLAPQSGAMGYGLPAAIAAKVAQPEKTVVCFAGDGDFQMTLQELATAKQANAQPVVLILNNGTYGTIRAHQERHYPTRVSGTDMVSPDFVMLAQSYGYHAERVEQTEDFEAAFERALASKTGAVLDLDISVEALTPRVTMSQMREAALKGKGA